MMEVRVLTDSEKAAVAVLELLPALNVFGKTELNTMIKVEEQRLTEQQGVVVKSEQDDLVVVSGSSNRVRPIFHQPIDTSCDVMSPMFLLTPTATTATFQQEDETASMQSDGSISPSTKRRLSTIAPKKADKKKKPSPRQYTMLRKRSDCPYCKEIGLNCGLVAGKCPNRPCSICKLRHRHGRCRFRR